jgi:hypothetical protein
VEKIAVNVVWPDAERPVRDLVPAPGRCRLKDLVEGHREDELVTNFPSIDDDILVMVAGGTAGRFSAVIPGWMGGGEMGSRPVTRAIANGREA